MASEPLCKLPWHSIYFHPDGTIRPCCISLQTLGEIEQHSISDVWNGEKLKKIRSELNEGKVPFGCESCFTKEKQGIGSRKMNFYSDLKDELKEVPLEMYANLEPSLSETLHLDLSLSNKCNLKCIFCGSDNSAGWFKERDELKKIDSEFFKEVIGIDDKHVNVSKELIDELLPHLENLSILELKGGEPLLAPNHNYLLQKLVDSGYSKNQSIFYSINGTQISDETLELWKKFKHVCISVSVDGTKDLYQYVRGGKYQLEGIILENLKKISSLDNIFLNIHYTLCLYNVFAIADYINWFEQNCEGLSPTKFGLVTNPNFLNISCLPPKLLKLAADKIPESARSEFREIKKTIENTESEYSDQLKHHFWKYTAGIDQVRGTNVLDHVPELKEYL